MEQKKKRPVNWMLRAASVLLCLVLASLYMVCGLFARYTTSASGSDSARVAKFEITDENIHEENITASLAPGEQASVDLSIWNKSEVAVEYTVTVVNVTHNLPLEFEVKGMTLEDGSFTANLPANGAKMTNYSLNIRWPGEEKTSALAGMVDLIKVTVSATQID